MNDWQNCPIKGFGIEYVVNGMPYTCVHRFHNSGYNKIYGKIMSKGSYHYYLLGSDNLIVELVRDDLLKLMKSNKIKVTNLKLSSDDKIYFANEYEAAMEKKAVELEEFKRRLKSVKDLEKFSNNKSTGYKIDNKTYREEIRKGMVLEVHKTSWTLRYPTIQNGINSMYPDGVFINGFEINEHIAEIKDCASKLCNHLKTSSNQDLNSSLCGLKYNIEYKSEIGEFLFGPYGGQFVVTGKEGIKQWLKDIEFAVNRVEEIREELGWKTHKGFLGKLFDAY